MTGSQPVRRLAVTMNGITIAYVMALVNAVLAAATSFGVHLTPQQQTTVTALVNAAMILTVHLSHRLGEAVASGASATVMKAQTEEMVTARTEAANGGGEPPQSQVGV